MIKVAGKKVVYLLGAGASAGVLPTVGEMREAFLNQDVWIRHAMAGSNFLETHGFPGYVSYLQTLADVSRSYGTVDVYARTLYLKKKFNELNELKLHLSIYFTLEQITQNKNYIRSGTLTPPGYSKQGQVDTRYLAWLSVLLNDDLTLSDRVSVISWNYDLQIEHALGQYFDLKQLSEVHARAGRWLHPDPNGTPLQSAGPPFLIHLNGIAGQINSKSGTDCLYNDIMNGSVRSHIEGIFKSYMEMHSNKEGAAECFTFAWERKRVAEEGLAFAKQLLTEADILVVIGYSFPSFNRFIDQELLQTFKASSSHIRDKKIVVQNRSMTRETFLNLFTASTGITGVHIEASTDQFYLPPELFN